MDAKWRDKDNRRAAAKFAKNTEGRHQEVRKPTKDGRLTSLYTLIGLASTICYANNIAGDFVHDDVKAITNNPDVSGESPLLAAFSNDFWGKPMVDTSSHKSYRPLCVLTFRLNHVLWPDCSVGFHIINNILHGFVSLLFTHFCKCVIFSGDVISSGIAGLMFAVHPIHTEAVSGIVGRADILCALFFLLSFLTYQRLLTSGYRPLSGQMSFVGTIFYATLALLCKEHGITVLGVCITYEAFIIWQSLRMADASHLRNNMNEITKGLKRILMLSLSSLALVVFRLWMLGGSLPKFQEEDNPASFSPHLLTRVFTYTYLWSFSCWLILCPSHLSHDWQMGSIPLVESVSDRRNFVSLFALLLMASLIRHTVCCKKVRHQRRVYLGLAFLVFPSLLTCNIFVTVGFVVAERVLYLPSMGVIILVTIGLDVLRHHLPKCSHLMKMSFVIFLVVMPACRTITRNQVWLSRETLARSGLQSLPNNAKMHYNYANLLAARGNISEAVPHYKTAVRLWPSYISAHNNLAHYLTNKTQALAHLTEVIRLQPCHANAFTNIADIYHRTFNETEAAIRLLRFAIGCEASNPSPHLSLATIYQELGRITLAETHYDKALQLAPRQAHVHYNIGLFYDRQGDLRRAAKHFEKATSLDPFSVSTLRALAGVHRKAGRDVEAENCFTKILAIRRDPANLDMVGTFYFNTGQTHKATKYFQEAYALEPKEDIAVHLSQALSAMLLYDEAEGLLKRHLAEGQLPLITQLANVYGLKKEHQKAIYLLSEFQNRRELSAKQLSAIHHQIGNHMKDMNQWYMAFKNYHKAVLLDPDNAESHHNLAVYFHRQGLFQKAIYHYQSAIRLRPDDNLLQKNYRSLLDLYRPDNNTNQDRNQNRLKDIERKLEYTKYGDLDRNENTDLDTLTPVYLDNSTNRHKSDMVNNATSGSLVDDVTGRDSRVVYVMSQRNLTNATYKDDVMRGSVTLEGSVNVLANRELLLSVVNKETP